MERIDKEMEDIAQRAIKLENGLWWSKRKLEMVERRDELNSYKKQIEEEILGLEATKAELESLLKDKREKIWKNIVKFVKKPERVERKMSKKQEEMELWEQTTLKWYKERYEQIIRDREEYNEKLLWALREMDIWVSEKRKKEVMKMIWESMNEEIGRLKEWDELIRKAEEVAKWLKENMEIMMKEISELEVKIKEMEREKADIKALGYGNMSIKEAWENIARLSEISRELAVLKDRRDVIKLECDEKCKIYYGMSSGDLVKNKSVDY